MHELDRILNSLAATQHRMVARAQVHAFGGTDQFIEDRLARDQWRALHPGTYLIGTPPLSWEDRVFGAVLAAGEGTTASHRAALRLWGLAGLASSPVELTVPFGNRPVPDGSIVHRSRRVEPESIIDGIAVSSVERTLLEAGTVVPPVVVEKAFASAWRRNLTSPAKSELYLRAHGGKGRRGTTLFRQVVALYAEGGRAPGSDGEVAFLRLLRDAGIEEPVRQWAIKLADGSVATVDFAWPVRSKAVEFVGLDTHADSRAHDADTWRENRIRDAGWGLRRYAPHSLQVRPEAVATAVIRFLCT